jgi:hypothetical protein
MLYTFYNAFTFVELIVYVKKNYYCAIAFNLSIVSNCFGKIDHVNNHKKCCIHDLSTLYF